uniref:uncharacterized protein LOC120341952 isoform X2 n=1 Tax=Styela clava TaxID=7725 RepID=UPI00193A99FE|nr:uncharacterized protein LOC120341952 isoform X2 [Styela clava]
MSSGTAISVSENNIKNITNITGPQAVEESEKTSNTVFKTDSSNMQNQKCSQNSLENHSPNQIDKNDHSHIDSNHILRPAMTENIKQVLNTSSFPSQGKSILLNNCTVEKKLMMTNSVGASGDGLPQNENIVLLKNQANILSCTASKDKEILNDKTSSIKTKNAPKISGQTYAIAARTATSNSGGKNAYKTTSKNPINPINVQSAMRDSEAVTVQKPAAEMNGIYQEPNDSDPNLITNSSPPVQISKTKSLSQSRMKLLVRSKAICQDDFTINLDSHYPLDSPLSSSSVFISDSIFPSPYPISREEALKETIGHISTRLPDDFPNTRQSSSSEAQLPNDQEIQILSNSERMTDAGTHDVSNENSPNNLEQDLLGAKLSSGSLRREAEKPPRMQKQRSQDRLLSKQQKPSFDTDKRETLSRESSIECVDSTGVDVHEFLITTLRNSTRDRAILLKIEHDMIDFVNDKKIDFMKFPPMTSYHRMLVHRVAAYFGMDHNVDETGKSVIINKTSSTRLPEVRFADQFDPRHPDPHVGRRDDDMRRRSILKRTHQSRSFDRDDVRIYMKGCGLWKDNRQRSIEEREEQYEKVRARIFNNPELANVQSPLYGRRGMSSIAAARIASWTDRPWNSTDLEPMSTGMRMPLSRPLTTRASSYSSISVLPRHNSATSVKTGSSSSVSSMNGLNNGMQNYPQNRPPLNMGHPRPPTPNRRSGGNSVMNESNNGAYYYMQQQNQGLPYLSPEGYQLFYQSGAVSSGMTSPQFAQYYQMPPQPSPNHPGMAYAHGYNPYQESPQKGANVPHASTNTDYTMMTPMSNYHQPNLSSTTTVYSGVQGHQNPNYPYQPPTSTGTGYNNSRSTQDQTPSSQTTMPMNHMVVNTNQQGKQMPIVPGQNYIQHPGGAPVGYPQYILTQQPANATPAPGQSQAPQPASKDTTTPQNPNGAVNTPRPLLQQPLPMMHPVPPMYQQQQAMHVIYSPPAPNAATPGSTDAYNQSVNNVDPTKSSNNQSHHQQQEPKKLAEDELNEKMQAIVLKNLQQQQEQAQVPDVAASNSPTTVTTSVTPSNNQIQATKQLQSQHMIPDQTGHNRILSHPPPSGSHQPNSQVQQGYQYHQYANPNGMQQHQQMQVYLMPANAPNAGNASYRTYSQFMTPPQTPHVMGTGMHLVYLSPPPMMGLDNSSTVPIPSSVPSVMQNPAHHHQHQSRTSQLTGEPTTQVYASNTNNNNVQSITDDAQNHGHNHSEEQAQTSDLVASKTDNINNGAPMPNSNDNSISPPAETNSIQEIVVEKDDLQPEISLEDSSVAEVPASTAAATDYSTQSHLVTANTSSDENQSGKQPAIMTTQSTHTAHNHIHYQVQPHHSHHHHHHAAVQYSNSPIMIQPDYRMAGIAMNAAAPYSTRVIPQYSMYPGITQTPYVYLPTAASNHNHKLSEVKMFPAQAASPTPGLIAVHVPNQNHIQLVPAASLQQHQQQNQIYYTPQNYMTSDYTNQPVTQSHHQLYTTTTTTTTETNSYAKQDMAVSSVATDQNHVAEALEATNVTRIAGTTKDSNSTDNVYQDENTNSKEKNEHPRHEKNKD